MTIFNERQNPARALYRLWDTIIKINGGENAHYGGSPSGAIYRSRSANGKRDAISYHALTVCADGRFRLSPMHGQTQRRRITQGTFLGYRWWRGQYNWFVDFNPPSYWQSLWSVENWRQPMPYASEAAMGSQHWGNGLWMELVPWAPTHGEAPWMMVPARNQAANYDSQRRSFKHSDRQRWDRFVNLRTRRYEQLEREELGIDLRPKDVSVRTPSVVHDGTKHEGQAAVTVIRALLDIHQPAKLAPRLKEAHA